MSDHAARSALLRLHHRELAIAMHYTGLASDLRMLASANQAEAEAAFALRRMSLVADYGLNVIEQRKPFAFSQGIAVIPVHGTLINRFSYSHGYVTGYNFIRQQTFMAGQDSDVQGIVYDHNTYGGEAAGCFECSADIKRLAMGKPTMAMVDSNSYSAGYAMAAGTDRIVLTPSGGTGSIGVVAAHVSIEKMLDDMGVKITFIHAGKHKVDGNPFEDLPPEVQADIQKSVNALYDSFVSLVAAGRGMDEKAVRATEARMYRADEALSLGLIDAIATPQEAMRAFLGELSGSNSQLSKENAMSNEAKPGGDNNTPPENMTAVKAEAAKAERARMSGITKCEEAKGREALATHLAYETDMSVDAAKAILTASPKTAAPQAANGFKAAMDNSNHPKVGADSGAAGGDAELTGAAAILASAKLAGVQGYDAVKH